ncbi:MAG TPA: ATP-binding protein [Ramlibacter sp.]|nr:ATP-binding protein [Ramlibacter sp.]
MFHLPSPPQGWLRTAPGSVVVAAAAVVLAMGGRWLLNQWLTDAWAFLFAFPMVALAAWFSGTAAGLLTVAGCSIWYLVPDLPPAPRPFEAGLHIALFAPTASILTVLVRALVPTPEGQDGSQLLFWLRSAAVLAILVPTLLFAAVAIHLYDLTVAEGQRRVERMARISHEHAQKLFQNSELLIARVDDLTRGLDGEQIRARSAQLHAELGRMVKDLAQVHSIWVLDDAGKPVLSSRVEPVPPGLDFSERASFRQHRDAPGLVVVTPPRLGQLTGEVFFDLSRRRDTSGGRFAGVIVVGLHPGYFLDFYRELLSAERGLVLTLVHTDGHLMVRWPETGSGVTPGARISDSSPMKGPMARGEAAGRVAGTSSFDGQPRIGAFRRIENYPVYAYAGLDYGATLAVWRRDVLALAAFVVPMAALLALVTVVALRRTRQQIAMAEQLRREGQEREKVEAALRQAQKLEAMGHLTGGVAHDFNNLLMVVELNTTILKQQTPALAATRPVQAIQRAVQAGTKLTRQLLAFSHRQPLLPRSIDFGERMPGLRDLVATVLGSKASVEAEAAPDTAAVLLDAGELELAMINLAVNARDALQGPGRIRIAARNAPDPAGGPRPHVVLTFSDDGPGMPAEVRERAFEPFFTTKPVGKGTGLGLSQVYGLCTRAGGRAVLESAPGQGTSVHLYFPASSAASADSAPAVADGGTQELELEVLLVEDNPEVASATRDLLQSMGCHVTHCPSAVQALATLAQGHRFDVVLSDVVMPGEMDGIALARELPSRHPGLPLVLMTGYAERLSEAEAMRAVVLPKPFDAQLLARALAQAVERSRSPATTQG